MALCAGGKLRSIGGLDGKLVGYSLWPYDIKSVATLGVPSEHLWPYDIKSVATLGVPSEHLWIGS